MKRSLHVLAAATLLLVLAAASAFATSNDTYGPREYKVIRDGTSPDRRYSIAAHGDGELGYDNFHIYLMAEPGHRKIGPLEEVGPEVLDTGADAYQAAWSADSRHVAVLHRTDRHVLAMRLYRIENRRAHPITGPSLAGAVLHREPESFADTGVRSMSVRLSWLGPTRFVLNERRLFKTATPDLARARAAFGKSEQDGATDSYLVDFSVEAVCELTAGDRYRIVELKPGRFESD
jgi:hypothetical protein